MVKKLHACAANKLAIVIPCFNEAESLPVTLAVLPREVEGCDIVEWLVIDDGSADNTAEIAKGSRGLRRVLGALDPASFLRAR